MDFRGTHVQCPGKGCIRQIPGSEHDQFEKNKNILRFHRHGYMLFANSEDVKK